jgi:hypothetical protein
VPLPSGACVLCCAHAWDVPGRPLPQLAILVISLRGCACERPFGTSPAHARFSQAIDAKSNIQVMPVATSRDILCVLQNYGGASRRSRMLSSKAYGFDMYHKYVCTCVCIRAHSSARALAASARCSATTNTSTPPKSCRPRPQFRRSRAHKCSRRTSWSPGMWSSYAVTGAPSWPPGSFSSSSVPYTPRTSLTQRACSRAPHAGGAPACAAKTRNRRGAIGAVA